MNPEGSTISRDELGQRQLRQVRDLLRDILPANRFWHQKLSDAGFDPRDLKSLGDFVRLPVHNKNGTRRRSDAASAVWNQSHIRAVAVCRFIKHRYHDRRAAAVARHAGELAMDARCWSQIYQLMDLHPVDRRLCFPVFVRTVPRFLGGFVGALRQGNMCVAAGGMSSEARLKLIEENRITILGVYSHLRFALSGNRREQGITLAANSVRAILVAGEPGDTSGDSRTDHRNLGRSRLRSLGDDGDRPAGERSRRRSWLSHAARIGMLAGSDRSADRTTAATGEMGELVITNFGRTGSPVIRYRTGDLVQAETSPHPSGRTWLRLKGGIQGRLGRHADHPRQQRPSRRASKRSCGSLKRSRNSA